MIITGADFPMNEARYRAKVGSDPFGKRLINYLDGTFGTVEFLDLEATTSANYPTLRAKKDDERTYQIGGVLLDTGDPDPKEVSPFLDIEHAHLDGLTVMVYAGGVRSNATDWLKDLERLRGKPTYRFKYEKHEALLQEAESIYQQLQ